MPGNAVRPDREHYIEAGRKGGNKVVERYGAAHMAAAGRIGGNACKERKLRDNPDYYREIGRKGGKQRVANMKRAVSEDQP